MMISLGGGATNPTNECPPQIPKACGLLNESPIYPKVVTPLIDWNTKHRVCADQVEDEILLGESLPPYVSTVFIVISSMILVLVAFIKLFIVIIQGQRMRISTPIIWIKLSSVLLILTLLASAGDSPVAHALSPPSLRIENEHVASVFQINASCPRPFDCGVRREPPASALSLSIARFHIKMMNSLDRGATSNQHHSNKTQKECGLIKNP